MSSPPGRKEDLGIFQYTARLADLAALIRDRNRWLRSNSVNIQAANGGLPANPYRVSLSVGIQMFPLSVPAGAAVAQLSFINSAGVALWVQTLVAKEADVAAVTPSPFFVSPPLLFDLYNFGPLLQEQVIVTLLSGVKSISLSECTFSGPNQPFGTVPGPVT
jgi:hypothetical protein